MARLGMMSLDGGQICACLMGLDSRIPDFLGMPDRQVEKLFFGVV